VLEIGQVAAWRGLGEACARSLSRNDNNEYSVAS
jgi:hypothetical protein